MSTVLRTELIPVQHFLQVVFGRPFPARLMEDNSATIVACEKGYSPSLRHIPRTQRIGLGFISEVVSQEATDEEGDIRIVKADTAEHRGDCFTKELSPQKFATATSLLRVQPLSKLKAKL